MKTCKKNDYIPTLVATLWKWWESASWLYVSCLALAWESVTVGEEGFVNKPVHLSCVVCSQGQHRESTWYTLQLLNARRSCTENDLIIEIIFMHIALAENK